jgi:hypothetical protein
MARLREPLTSVRALLDGGRLPHPEPGSPVIHKV